MTNELKCPVIKSCHTCGNYSKKGDWRICRLLDKAIDGSGINHLAERLPDCPFTVEKAAAVQEERKRVAIIEERYNKILMAVQHKNKGEERWEAALRYVQEIEDMIRLELELEAEYKGDIT